MPIADALFRYLLGAQVKEGETKFGFVEFHNYYEPPQDPADTSAIAIITGSPGDPSASAGAGSSGDEFGLDFGGANTLRSDEPSLADGRTPDVAFTVPQGAHDVTITVRDNPSDTAPAPVDPPTVVVGATGASSSPSAATSTDRSGSDYLAEPVEMEMIHLAGPPATLSVENGAMPMTDHREIVATQPDFSDNYDFTVSSPAPGVTSSVILNVTSHDSDSGRVVIPVGTQFVPTKLRLQVMVVVKQGTFSIEPGKTVTTTLETICASPFGFAPPSSNGTDVYTIAPTISPVVHIVNAIDTHTDAYVDLANQIALPIDRFKNAMQQYTTWSYPWTVWYETSPTPDGSPESGQGPGIRGSAPGAGAVSVPTPTDPPIAPFNQDSIASILGPQLRQNGASDEQVNTIATTFWSGVELTVKFVEEGAPGTAEAVMAAGLPFVGPTGGQ